MGQRWKRSCLGSWTRRRMLSSPQKLQNLPRSRRLNARARAPLALQKANAAGGAPSTPSSPHSPTSSTSGTRTLLHGAGAASSSSHNDLHDPQKRNGFLCWHSPLLSFAVHMGEQYLSGINQASSRHPHLGAKHTYTALINHLPLVLPYALFFRSHIVNISFPLSFSPLFVIDLLSPLSSVHARLGHSRNLVV